MAGASGAKGVLLHVWRAELTGAGGERGGCGGGVLDIMRDRSRVTIDLRIPIMSARRG